LATCSEYVAEKRSMIEREIEEVRGIAGGKGGANP